MVVLAILKWIGIILGGVLGLALLLVFLIVFVPVRYHLSGNNRDELQYQYRVSWLFRAVSVAKRTNSGKVWFRLFGIPFIQLAGEKTEKGKTEKEKTEKATTRKEETGLSKKEPKQKEIETSISYDRKVSGKASADKVSGIKKPKETQERKKFFSFGILSGIIAFVRDTENKNAFHKIWNELGMLVQYLAPRKIQGHLLIGTGDPSSTGLLIGGISLFPFVYQDEFNITPDFDEKIFQAEGMIKGRVRVLYLLRLCIRLYRDKELRKLWDNIQKLKKEAA